MWTVRCWPELVSPLNLWRAWRDFSRAKRRRPDVAAFALDADRHVHRLARALAAETWRPGPFSLRYLADPKRRVIAAAGVDDRVVHHAIHRLVAPRFLRGFIDHTYACLPERGSHRAILRFQRSMVRHRFVLQLDVRRYFYSIDREVLARLLFRRLPEAALQRLVGRILDSGASLYRRPEVVEWLGWDGPAPAGRGLPIGNLTSQLWANVYLDELDHLVTRRMGFGSYQRYMDDLTLFGDDRAALVAARDDLGAWLGRERGLELKEPAAQPVRTEREVEYLGHLVSRRGVRVGRKARERLPDKLDAAAGRRDLGRLHAVVGAYAAIWRFGP